MKRGFAAIIVLGIVVSIIALSTIFYLKQKSTNSQKIGIQPSPTLQSSPSSETENWKTYTDIDQKIDFEHLNNWQVKKEDDGYLVDYRLAPSGANSDVSITVFNNPDNLSLKDFDAKLPEGGIFAKNKLSKNNIEVQTSQKVTAYFNTEPIQFPGGFDPYERYIIPYSGKIFVIQHLTDSKVPDQKVVFERIFSTFKFSE